MNSERFFVFGPNAEKYRPENSENGHFSRIVYNNFIESRFVDKIS